MREMDQRKKLHEEAANQVRMHNVHNASQLAVNLPAAHALVYLHKCWPMHEAKSQVYGCGNNSVRY